jgi:hypothetical protein
MLMQDVVGNAVDKEAQVDGIVRWTVHHVKDGATEKQAVAVGRADGGVS